MNERIKELYKEAYRRDCLENNPNWKEGPGFERFTKMMEGTSQKFAELIVRECSEFVRGRAEKAMSQEILAVGDELVKHFGVEE